MRVLPQTPLDWVLLAVGTATAIIIAVAIQDFFVDSRVNKPRIRALQDVGVGIAVTHFGVLLVRGSAGPGWAIAGIAMYVVATMLFLGAIEAARRVPLARTLVDDPPPASLITNGPFAVIRQSDLPGLFARVAGSARGHARPRDCPARRWRDRRLRHRRAP